VKLTVHTFLTLDGVMQAPGGAHEDTSGGFTAGGWQIPFIDNDFGRIVDGWFRRTDAILLGRNTFQTMKPHWSRVTDPDDIVAAKLNGAPKFVVSTTLTDPGWGDTTVLTGNVIDEVTALKARPGGELQVHGSAQLVGTLAEAGLVDELRLLVFPVAVGKGKRLFPQSLSPTGFTVVDSTITSTGAVYTALIPAPFTTGEA
jgi:dihydrofolate reductase